MDGHVDFKVRDSQSEYYGAMASLKSVDYRRQRLAKR